MDTQDMNLNSGENSVSLSKEKDTFIPGGRAVGAGAATEWIGNAWEMFKAKPPKWILLTLVYFLIVIALQFIPIVSIVAALFGSVFIAGFIAASEKQRTTGDFEIELLFYGFKNKFGSLVAVGALVFGIYILGVIAAIILGGTSIIQILLAGQDSDPMLLMGSFSTLMLAMLVILFFSIVALAFSWFAPALIIINDLKFGEAISMSLSAVRKNLFSGFLFFLLMGILVFISAIPLGLGLLATFPMYMATYYTTYRSIFYATETQETKSHLVN
ncbi:MULTISPECIES: BPSS1780 family membrane protein [Xenorhabdus]|uniref:Membrane protein n=1 Tax=Xenorhabdus ehlersii TaxID=290111 RepID=A0A2D0IUA4_9GAMM|nr:MULTISPECIES: BPSS1780 family membrane protein [Xenorhabdus]MBC8948879.1 membrane protein [Xenorhabdus sp. TS4]PHM25389.1 membrane protein [Xenorhabdus ehlersii]RKE90518.1 putative membrane protein [Xenorhabdus ehlersii]